MLDLPLPLLIAAQFAVFALLDFGTGEITRLLAIGLQVLLLIGFVFWRFGRLSSEWPSQPDWVIMLALAALALIVVDKPGMHVGVMFFLLGMLDRIAGPAPDETWPPEPDPPADAVWPSPSPANSGAVAFFGGIIVCLPPTIEKFFYLGLFFVVLMMLRGFAVAHHSNWRPMPLWRPGLLLRYGPIACYAVFVVGLHGAWAIHRIVIALLFPFLLLALSNLGENLGRRWMAGR